MVVRRVLPPNLTLVVAKTPLWPNVPAGMLGWAGLGSAGLASRPRCTCRLLRGDLAAGPQCIPSSVVLFSPREVFLFLIQVRLWA